VGGPIPIAEPHTRKNLIWWSAAYLVDVVEGMGGGKHLRAGAMIAESHGVDVEEQLFRSEYVAISYPPKNNKNQIKSLN